MIRFTQSAQEVLRAAAEAAARFDENARIRVRRKGSGVTFELTDGPASGDSVVPGEGFELLVAEGIEGTVDAGEHGVLTLFPEGP